MGDPEIMDLFPDSNNRDGLKDPDEISDDGYHYTGRSRINDYKHSSNSIHKSKDPIYSQERYPRQKSYINVSDERIVWAGAIFVFFGVFIFLIGYWLGKTTLKDITFGNKGEIQKIEEKIDQKKTENSFAFNNAPIPDIPKKDNNAITPVQEETNLPNIKGSEPENFTAPPINGDNSNKTTLKNVKLKSGFLNAKKTVKQKNTKKTESTNEGNFTIQVSAHTSMEKAREVENELRKMGLESYLVEANVNGIVYYRVRVGKFQTKDDAQKAILKIKESSFGKDSMILDLM
jgi:cell division septation protein DedD